MMNNAVFSTLVVFLFPVSLSQPTSDAFGSSSCQLQDHVLLDSLRSDVGWIRNELTQVKGIVLSQSENKQPARSCEYE